MEPTTTQTSTLSPESPADRVRIDAEILDGERFVAETKAKAPPSLLQ
jgi:hypothetical protein